jgi:hypothetical protein
VRTIATTTALTSLVAFGIVDPADPQVVVGLIAITILVTLSYPLQTFPLRNSLDKVVCQCIEAFQRWRNTPVDSEQYAVPRFITETLLICGCSYGLTMVVSDLGVVCVMRACVLLANQLIDRLARRYLHWLAQPAAPPSATSCQACSTTVSSDMKAGSGARLWLCSCSSLVWCS